MKVKPGTHIYPPWNKRNVADKAARDRVPASSQQALDAAMGPAPRRLLGVAVGRKLSSLPEIAAAEQAINQAAPLGTPETAAPGGGSAAQGRQGVAPAPCGNRHRGRHHSCNRAELAPAGDAKRGRGPQ